MTTLTNPDELQGLAAELQSQSLHLRREHTELGDRVRSMTWEGPAADRFRDRARTRLRDLDCAAAELDACARTLLGSVETTAAERRVLAGIESEVHRLRTTLGPATFAQRLEAAGIAGLPPSGDPCWRSVGRKLLGGRA